MGNLFYCYTTNQNSKEEKLNYIRMREDTIFYDYDRKYFCDCFGYQIDIEGKRILFQGYIEEIEEVINAILANKGIPINSLEDINTIKTWQKYIPIERRGFITKGKDILESEWIRQKIKRLANKERLFFLKTIEKDFSGPIGIEELENREYGLLPALEFHKEDIFSISEMMNIEKDAFGNIEYRCFVIDGEIVSISRALLKTLHSIPEDAIRAAENILLKIKRFPKFPKTFALDFMLCEVPSTKTLIYDIVELNPIEATGEYIYNTIYKDALPKLKPEERKLSVPTLSVAQEMHYRLPIYKRNQSYSYTYNEPCLIFHQSYYKEGFSLKYGSAKKFGNPLQDRFYEHVYGGMIGPSYSISTEEILNGNIPVSYLLKPHVIENLKKALDIDFDVEKIKRGIELEEEQKRMRSRIKKEVEKNK